MNAITLFSREACGCAAVPVFQAVMNPPMSYDGSLGTPTAQGISPPFTNLPAQIYEINGLAQTYSWNTITGVWL